MKQRISLNQPENIRRDRSARLRAAAARENPTIHSRRTIVIREKLDDLVAIRASPANRLTAKDTLTTH